MPKTPPHRKVVRLMNELRAWCEEERGRKSEIARILGVDRQRVSDWIALRAFPSLGIGLQLLYFLQREKGRKSAGRTIPPTPAPNA